MKRSLFGQVVGLVVVCVGAALALWLYFNQQYVIDQVAVWQYQPTSEVASLAARTDMSVKGKFIFYASQPKVETAATFNADCNSIEQSSAILGCYTGTHIYIYDVADTQLDGIKETTAAHEMLHAAYQRLSSSERTTVNKLVEAEYATLKNNPDFATRMALYAKTEPGQRDNELHSIIGTEVSKISPQLETYYKQYFTNRQSVVNLHSAYNAVFSALNDKRAALEAQLTTLSDTINTQSAQYNTDTAQLNADIASFNARAGNNGFSSQAAFNTQRASLMDRIAALSTERDTINTNITSYQALYTQYQAVAGRSNTLNQSINSKLAPAPSL